MAVWTSLVLTTALFTTSAFAADSDPLTIVNNLSDFIFSCIKAIGIIILGWGVVQLGMSVQSHDATQRTPGVLCLFGGEADAGVCDGCGGIFFGGERNRGTGGHTGDGFAAVIGSGTA